MKLSNFISESFQHYNVKHKPTGKTYRVTAMSQASAKTKAAVQHGGRSASRYSGTSDDQFEIVENNMNNSNDSLKALAEHVKKQVPLCDSIFRYQSEAYFDTFKTAKKLREAGSLPELDWESEEMLGTDIGESVELKGVGRVWLDVPYLNEDDDDFVYASDLIYFDKNGKEIGYMDFDGIEDANTNHSEQELQVIAQKFNITPKDGKVVGYFDASEDEVEFSNDLNDETYPEGSIGVYIDSHNYPKESIEEAEEGMIGEPDAYYDAEERRQAYNDLQDALEQSSSVEAMYVKDGQCPECPNVEDDEDCYGFGNYGCDDGILTYDGDDVSWKEIQDHDERNAQRQQAKANYPGDDAIIQQAAKMMPNMDDPRMIVQQIKTDYPQLGRAKASELAGKAKQIAFPESVENESMGGKDGKAPAVPYSKSTEKDLADRIWKASDERKRKAKDEKNKVKEGDSEDAPISKMLAKALGDENRWTEMTPQELFAELESKDSETADMIALLAKSLYDVKLKERVYKDVGVADVVKDQRGKEFKFDKNTKKFKSQDGEEADISTKLGKDLMRLRKNHMKRTSPSYPKKHKVMASEAEYQGKDVELNKPKRGGSKKYYVYVKTPKGNVKKISFGDPGLKTKSGNKARAKSFAARHNCEKKNDKQKAGYWACRLPRYGLVKGGKWW